MSLTPSGSESSVSGQLTCISCRVLFKEGDAQRAHYKSDWHRYNLKRKMLALPPVTQQLFQDKLAAQQAQQAEADKDRSTYCHPCKKPFGNENAFLSHLTSKKHSQMVQQISAAGGELAKDFGSKCVVNPPEGASSQSSSAGVSKRTPTTTAFPGKGERLGSLAGASMESDDDDDDDSWEEILGNPIPSNQCLFCNHESENVEVNVEHMSEVHSFFIPDVEYCVDVGGLLDHLGGKVGEGMLCLWCNHRGRAFYDLLSVQQHMRDKGHCKLQTEGDLALEFSDFYDFSPSYPPGDEGEEPPQPHPLTFNENMQLVLPSGQTLGHRALRRYYRQYVRPGSRTMDQLKASKRAKLLAHYKAIGYTQTPTHIAQKKLRDQKYLKYVKDKFSVQLGVQGNKTLQKHFRNQVMF